MLLVQTLAFAETAAQRHWLPVQLIERSRMVDSSGDMMLNPQKVVACGGILAVLDVAGPAVAAFSVDGTRRWRYARSGGGPGELGQVTDLACTRAPAPGIAVLDRGNNKVITLHGDGRLATERRLDVDAYRMTAVDSGTFLASAEAPSIARVHPVPSSGPHAIAAPDGLPTETLRRELQFGSARIGTAVMAFRWSHVAYISDHARRSLTALKGAPEPVPWPELRIASARSGGVLLTRVAPNAVEAVRSVAADRDTVFMVFVGTSPDSGRVMDLYAIESREYAGSIRLPVAPISIAAFRDGLAAVVSDPVPTLLVWQRARRPR